MDTEEDVKPAHTYHRDGSDYSLQINRWLLKPVGAWPSSTTTIREKIQSTILVVICYSLIAFTAVPCALNTLFEDTDIHEKIKILGPLSHWCMGSVNYLSLLCHRREIRYCVQHIKTDWRIVTEIEDRRVMFRYAKIGRFIASLCTIFMHGGLFAHNFLESIPPTIAYIGNESVIIHTFTCPFYSEIVDIRYSPGGEIVLVFQFFSCFIVNAVTVGACSLAAVFAMHACGQLHVLMRWMDQLLDDQRQHKTVQRRIAAIVEHHLRVLSFVAHIEAVMNQICFVELLGCTFNLCMIGYYTITGWNVVGKKTLTAFFIIYMSMTFNIFIFCYVGEVLTEKCKQIGETAYTIEWYRLPHKTALGLILIISRSSIVTKLTAGKLVHLSIATFGDVIKSSMAYLNMLRTMMA